MHPIRTLGLALLVPCLGCDGTPAPEDAPPPAAADRIVTASGRMATGATRHDGRLTHGQHASSSRRYRIEGRLVQARTPEGGR